MPQIKARNIKAEDLCRISKPLVDELQSMLGCPRDFFTLELIHSTFIQDGEVTSGYPYVEIAWFDRGQETQDKVAKLVTSQLKNLGYENVDIFFTLFEKASYYENGEHF
ncbi:DUF1904 domain-containing protein [Clostridium hydrogeniformans]|uniref:DUF1904 domain-containing protein n=1 Tax=Clostridium hydrogeniformans TaxID=349933 RepID=UPI000484A3E1|nr:DUF1904 domain-containing protein [Clostridium hydrogeniformans]